MLRIGLSPLRRRRLAKPRLRFKVSSSEPSQDAGLRNGVVGTLGEKVKHKYLRGAALLDLSILKTFAPPIFPCVCPDCESSTAELGRFAGMFTNAPWTAHAIKFARGQALTSGAAPFGGQSIPASRFCRELLAHTSFAPHQEAKVAGCRRSHPRRAGTRRSRASASRIRSVLPLSMRSEVHNFGTR